MDNPVNPAPDPDLIRHVRAETLEEAARAVEMLYIATGGGILCADTLDEAVEQIRALQAQAAFERLSDLELAGAGGMK